MNISPSLSHEQATYIIRTTHDDYNMSQTHYSLVTTV